VSGGEDRALAAAGAASPGHSAEPEPASGLGPDGRVSPSADELREVANRFEPKDFEPFIRRAADELYERILHSCEDYLRDNVEWNIGSHIAMLTRDNDRMRTELFEVDEALGCLSLGQTARLRAIRETEERRRQASAECWRLREKLAPVDPACREVLDYINGNAPGLAHAVEQRLLPLLDEGQ
jgi:hypothetical protein